MVEVQRLENIDDLDCLVRGDLIETEGDEFRLGAYHQKNEFDQYELIFPSKSNEEGIVMDRVRKSKVKVSNGTLVYNRDECAIEAFSKGENFRTEVYHDLNDTLKMAGLRN